MRERKRGGRGGRQIKGNEGERDSDGGIVIGILNGTKGKRRSACTHV